MCGIAGAFGYSSNGPPIRLDIIERINEAQARRGPDGAGLWASNDSRIALAHRRLAIIDTGPSGAQPMFDIEGRWAITFNGEIYNYKALRSELERCGVRFKTQSDTEVLINAVATWGERALSKLRGMFAFALWDSQQQELWLARDPYGIKPLYVAKSDGVIWFASQARSLASFAPIGRGRDPAGLVGFYIWGHIPEPFTWWSEVSQIPAGHFQRFRKGEPPGQVTPYVQIEDCYRSVAPPPADRATLAAVLRDSVQHHLVSDVPVGIFLSSGFDSSVIASLAAESGATLRSVTLAFEEYKGTSYDEAPLAEVTAKLIGAEHTTVRIGREEFYGLYDDFLSSMDQPSIDGLNSYLVSHAAANAGLKVVLSGMGGDELFGGYPSFSQIPLLLKFGRAVPSGSAAPHVIERCLSGLLGRFMPPKASGLARYSGSVADAFFLRRSLHLPSELERLLDVSWIERGMERLQTRQMLNGFVSNLAHEGGTVHAQIAALETCWYMRNQLLRDTDWASMAHGIEVRVPFADIDVLRQLGPAIASTSPPIKRDLLLSELKLPPELGSRPKTGFSTPVRDWISSMTETPARGLRGWAGEVHRYFRSSHRYVAA